MATNAHNERGTWANFHGIFSRLVNNSHQPTVAPDDASNRSLSPVTVPIHQQPVDKKLFEKAWKRMDEVVRHCQHPQIKLKNSPPYLLEILPECYRHLYNVLDNSTSSSLDTDYIRIFLLNMIAKCKRVKRLFTEAKEKMYDEKSQARRDLTKFALVFSHMFFELKSLYPADKNYTFIGTEGPNGFKITKVDAADWWRASFGSTVIVPWEEYLRKFCDLYRIDTRCEILALKTTLDLTCDDYVSIFEFDVFTRLFQPWNNLLACWKLLAVVHPAFVAFMTYDDVKEKLGKFVNKPGSYIFRMSCTRLGQWAIGYVTTQGEILQTIPQNKSLAQALVDGQNEGFYKYPNGQDIDGPDISVLLSTDIHEDQVVVSQEMYEVYVEMGTTFQACKICTDRDKDTRIEPCGHLICSVCVNKWMNHDRNHSCPFCRREIKGTGPIRVEVGAASIERHKSSLTRGTPVVGSPKLNSKVAGASRISSQLSDNGIQRAGSSPDLPSSSSIETSSRAVSSTETNNSNNGSLNVPPPATLPPPLPPAVAPIPLPTRPKARNESVVPEISLSNNSDSTHEQFYEQAVRLPPPLLLPLPHTSPSSSLLQSTTSTTNVPMLSAPPLPRSRSSIDDAFVAELISAGYEIEDIAKAVDIAEGNEVIARKILTTYVLPPSTSNNQPSSSAENGL